MEDVFQKNNINQNDTILELACGTGAILKFFQMKYYNIVGLDISMQMLKLSQKKTNVPLVLADLKKLPFKDASFKAIYCNHDSVNYLNSQRSLRKHLEEIKRILIKGGIYIFDVATEKNVLKNYHKKTISESHEDISISWKNKYLPKDRKIISRMEFYKSFGGCIPFWKRKIGREIHVQIIYKESFLESVLSDLGFDLIEQIADYDFNKKIQEADLMVYVISKK